MDSLTVHAVFAFEYIVLHSPQHLSRRAYLNSFPPLCKALDSLLRFGFLLLLFWCWSHFSFLAIFLFAMGDFFLCHHLDFSSDFLLCYHLDFPSDILLCHHLDSPSDFLLCHILQIFTFVMGCSYQNISVSDMGWSYHCNLPSHLILSFC